MESGFCGLRLRIRTFARFWEWIVGIRMLEFGFLNMDGWIGISESGCWDWGLELGLSNWVFGIGVVGFVLRDRGLGIGNWELGFHDSDFGIRIM